MGIFDSEKYLAGVSTEVISDSTMSYDTTQWNTTSSVVVIGTAFNGPTGVLVPVWNPTHARYIFGGTYNAKTKKEVDLVAGIQEAWDKGCRTIFGMRVGGKDLYKDFELCVSSKYKLRVSSMYPTNTGKQAYLTYSNVDGQEEIAFYKLPERATINERTNGMVESTKQMIVNRIRLNQDYGYTKDSPLVDVINLFNQYTFNNVLRLSIVDKDGADVTKSAEVYSIPFGAMFPGVYFIGRSKNAAAMPIETRVQTNFVFDANSPLPYSSFTGSHYNTLSINTDVSADYPIYGPIRQIRSALAKAGISMIKENDYLEVLNASNRAFPEDDVDYEEVSLTDFEKYKKLGKGFAITAHLERRTSKDGKELMPKVIETKTDDQNRIIGIEEGIYSVLQDAPVDYRVLGGQFAADKIIGGKLPKPKDFLASVPNSISLIKSAETDNVDNPNLINLNAVTDTSRTDIPTKKYKVSFNVIDANMDPLSADTVFTQVFTLVPLVAKEEDIDLTVQNGTKVLVGTKDSAKLYRVIDGKAIEESSEMYDNGTDKHTYFASTIITDTKDEKGAIKSTSVEHVLFKSKLDSDKLVFTGLKLSAGTTTPAAGDDTGVSTAADNTLDLKGKKYLVIDISHNLYVWKVDGDAITPLADYDSLKNTNWSTDDILFVYAENLPMAYNLVQISSPYFDTITLQDFVNELNENDLFNDLFTIELTTQGLIVKDEYMKGTTDYTGIADSVINDAKASAPVITDFGVDHNVVYDYTAYIPYRTTDNFARQLAQHCTYTELKTARTHGIIGMSRLVDTSLSAIARKVNHILEFNFDMYAKKNNGRDLLDNNNLPVNVGRNVSMIFVQEYVTDSDSAYSFMSNGAAAYAGLVSQLPITRSSTMYTMDISPIFELTHSQLQSLTDAGIVTIRNTYTKGFCVTDGVTAADQSDIMSRLNVVRIAGAVEQVIRGVCEPYIGLQNTTANRNSMQTSLTSGFKNLASNGLISSYDFDIIDDSTVAYYTTVTIQYEIVPIGEIRRVHNVITIRANAS